VSESVCGGVFTDMSHKYIAVTIAMRELAEEYVRRLSADSQTFAIHSRRQIVLARDLRLLIDGGSLRDWRLKSYIQPHVTHSWLLIDVCTCRPYLWPSTHTHISNYIYCRYIYIYIYRVFLRDWRLRGCI